jgi:hypothetical protein
MAKHKTIAEWQFLVDQFLQGKQKIKDFCNQNNVNLKTFENKYYQLRYTKNLPQPKVDSVANTRAFLKVTLPSTQAMKIKLPNGIILELAYKNLSAVIKELLHVV